MTISGPLSIPENLVQDFTINNSIKVENWYHPNGCPDDYVREYKIDEIEKLINKAARREVNYYGDTDLFLYSALDKYNISGKDVVVMGSVVPWYESICLQRGVSRCNIIEYTKISCEDERIKTIRPDDYDYSYNFDFGLSISSFEHDGLARYGDPINPNGDLEAMAKMKKTLKKGGLLFLAVPVGVDKVVWNAHRIYGRIRLPKLFDGWRLVESFGFIDSYLDVETGCDARWQPVFVLENI